MDPTAEVDGDIPDGVVADKVFVERFEPDSTHSQEVMDEDDAFLGVASAELWEYDIVDGREQDFLDAMRNSQTVMEYNLLDETGVEPGDATGVSLANNGTTDSGEIDFTSEAAQGGSGTSSVGDGPAGMQTGDPSADGMGPSRPYSAGDDAEGIADEGSGGLDDLTVVSADDPNLGLTDYGKKGPDDWAADTGPTATPGRGARTGG